MFKKISLLFILTLFIGLPVFVLAVPAGGWSPTSIENPLTATSFTELLTSIIEWVRNIGVLIAVIMIIWAGFLFMTAGGTEEKVTKARKTLIWALVGMAILIMGENFIALIQSILSSS